MATILETACLSRHFGGFTAVDQVSLRVAEGAFHSVIGPNGAGKTTLFNLLSGELKPSGGRVIYRGADITGLAPHRIARLGIGRSFQITSLFPNLSVRENIRLAVQSQAHDHGRFARSWSLWRRADADRDTLAKADRIAEQVGLAGREALPVHVLAHGDKRKLEIGVLLALEPSLLLLDEPTAGMSREEVPQIYALLRRLKDEGRRTILLVEHKMDVVLRLSDRISVLAAGQLIAEGTPAEISQNEQVRTAYLGVPHGQPA